MKSQTIKAITIFLIPLRVTVALSSQLAFNLSANILPLEEDYQQVLLRLSDANASLGYEDEFNMALYNNGRYGKDKYEDYKLENIEYGNNKYEEYDRKQEDNLDERASYDIYEVVDFSFDNGQEGLEALRELLLIEIDGLSGNHSIYVKNLDTNEYLIINDRAQTPASLIKLFTMVYAFDRIERGALEANPLIEQWLYHMIVISCNNSYNHLLVTMGYGNLIQGAMNTTDFGISQGFTDTIVGASLSPSYFESVGFSNLYTSALDVGHLLENIYRGTMVSKEASSQMLDILLAQQRLNKIPAGLPEGTIVASKTGEVDFLEHDAGIVFSQGANYVIVIMTENAWGAIENIQRISGLVYAYFNFTFYFHYRLSS
jgi:beta-lactamase class A